MSTCGAAVAPCPVLSPLAWVLLLALLGTAHSRLASSRAVPSQCSVPVALLRLLIRLIADGMCRAASRGVAFHQFHSLPGSCPRGCSVQARATQRGSTHRRSTAARSTHRAARTAHAACCGVDAGAGGGLCHAGTRGWRCVQQLPLPRATAAATRPRRRRRRWHRHRHLLPTPLPLLLLPPPPLLPLAQARVRTVSGRESARARERETDRQTERDT